MNANADTDAANWCISAADRCVMCGLCLPHCPTYALERNEADSPRGRISLIKALASSELAPDKALVAHLEGCLQCRRCEAACPAQVSFGRLMDTAKQLLFKARVLTRVPRWLEWLVVSRRLRRLVSAALFLYQASGLRRLARATGVLKILRLETPDAMLSATSAVTPLPKSTAAAKSAGQTGEQVALFTGCVAEIFDRDTLAASKRLLEAAGFAVSVPAQQSCCSALHQHAGDVARARRFIDKNTEAFSGTSPQTVVSCASGCGAQLKEHEATLGVRHFDVHAFLQTRAGNLRFRPLEKTVALHTPCTMDSCLNGTKAVSDLLARVPGLAVSPLPNRGCCGAAGAYMLTRPRTARRLLDDVLEPLAQTGAETLLSSNIGCLLHLRRGVARRGMNVEVLHPATLLDRQLQS